jgi:hypothetical protein
MIYGYAFVTGTKRTKAFTVGEMDVKANAIPVIGFRE